MVLYQLWAKRLPFWPTLKDARLASVEDVHRAVLEVCGISAMLLTFGLRWR